VQFGFSRHQKPFSWDRPRIARVDRMLPSGLTKARHGSSPENVHSSTTGAFARARAAAPSASEAGCGCGGDDGADDVGRARGTTFADAGVIGVSRTNNPASWAGYFSGNVFIDG
jgi:hypothetical protein